MGTRSTVKFYEEFNNRPILCVYHQFDGYFEGVGKQLAIFLKDKKILNGFNAETMKEGYANGMGCLAAQYVASIKKDIGEVYLMTLNSSEEYNYHVRLEQNKLIIKVDQFDGTPEEFLNDLK